METLVILSKFFKVKGDSNGIPLPMLSRISMKNQNLSAPVKLMLLNLNVIKNKFGNFHWHIAVVNAHIQHLQYNIIFHKYEMFTPKHIRYQIMYQVNVIY